MAHYDFFASVYMYICVLEHVVTSLTNLFPYVVSGGYPPEPRYDEYPGAGGGPGGYTDPYGGGETGGYGPRGGGLKGAGPPGGTQSATPDYRGAERGAPPPPPPTAYMPAPHQQGAVLMVYGLDPLRTNTDKLFNLMCLYGNVARVSTK